MTEVLAHLQLRYEALLRQLLPDKPVSDVHLRIATHPTHNGDAHVEVVDGKFHYIVTERGAELQRRIAKSEDELLYWLMDDVTWSISGKRKVSLFQGLLGRDPRRRSFALHVRLLARLNPEWAARKRAYYDGLLLRHPYMDRR